MTSLAVTYTVAELAESLGVTEWWIREQVKRGRVSPLRIGDGPRAPMRFTPQDVEQLYESLRPPEPLPRKRRRHRRAS